MSLKTNHLSFVETILSNYSSVRNDVEPIPVGMTLVDFLISELDKSNVSSWKFDFYSKIIATKTKGSLLKRIKKEFPIEYVRLLNSIKGTISLQSIYCFLNDIKEFPKCVVCDNITYFRNFTNGFARCCSNSCRQKDPITREKIRLNSLRKYGTESPNQNILVKQKKRIKFDAKTEEEILAIKQKSIATNISKYGVSYATQNKKVRERTIATNICRYGVTAPAKNKDIRKKMKETCIEKYGVENPTQHENIRNKIAFTNLERYGSICSLNDPKIKKKAKKTLNKNFGVDFPLQSLSLQNKFKKTCVERYGVDYPMQDPLRLAKMQKTAFIRHPITLKNKTWWVQGYEDVALWFFIQKMKLRHQIINIPKECFAYGTRKYNPDFKIGKNLFIEVKSKYTCGFDPDTNSINKETLRKLRTVVKNGKQILLLIFQGVNNQRLLHNKPRKGKLFGYLYLDQDTLNSKIVITKNKKQFLKKLFN